MGWRQVGVGGNKSIGVEIERMESMGEAGRFFLLNSSTWENQNQDVFFTACFSGQH